MNQRTELQQALNRITQLEAERDQLIREVICRDREIMELQELAKEAFRRMNIYLQLNAGSVHAGSA